MAQVLTLLTNPEESAKQLSIALYAEIENGVKKQIMELMEPTVQKLTQERLKTLKTYMERDFFGGAMLVKVFLNDKPIEEDAKDQS